MRTPHVWNQPAITRTQSVSAPTRVGTSRSVVSPNPSCPSLLDPQHHRDRSVRTPHVFSYEPAVTRAQSVSAPTRVGTSRSVVSPNPSCP